MTRLFEERERAAEMAFIREEEVRFLARRRGVQALASWASGVMGHDAETAERFEQDLVVSMVKGASDTTLVAAVSASLGASGHESEQKAAQEVFAGAATVAR